MSEADGSTILTSIQAFQPTIIDALNAIVAKQSALAALPIGGVTALVKQDLIILNGNTTVRYSVTPPYAMYCQTAYCEL